MSAMFVGEQKQKEFGRTVWKMNSAGHNPDKKGKSTRALEVR